MITLEDLDKAYNNHTITDFLKLLNDEDLSNLMYCIMLDDLTDTRIGVYDALYNEIEYRKDEDLAFHNFMSGTK